MSECCLRNSQGACEVGGRGGYRGECRGESQESLEPVESSRKATLAGVPEVDWGAREDLGAREGSLVIQAVGSDVALGTRSP